MLQKHPKLSTQLNDNNWLSSNYSPFSVFIDIIVMYVTPINDLSLSSAEDMVLYNPN